MFEHNQDCSKSSIFCESQLPAAGKESTIKFIKLLVKRFFILENGESFVYPKQLNSSTRHTNQVDRKTNDRAAALRSFNPLQMRSSISPIDIFSYPNLLIPLYIIVWLFYTYRPTVDVSSKLKRQLCIYPLL